MTSDAATNPSGPVMFVSYTGLAEPLGESQVLGYVESLARDPGVRFEILSFEKGEDASSAPAIRERLGRQGIGWTPLRYHRRPSLAASSFDIAHGVARASMCARARGVRLLHARQYVPGAIALGVKRLTGIPFVFDIRGLMAEEYADAGHWREGELKYRLVKRAEASILEAADAIVVLTEAFAEIVVGWEPVRRRKVPVTVVPCCVDLRRFRFSPDARRRVRNELGLGDELVVVYSGSLGGWYLDDELARFVAALRRVRPGARLLALTRSEPSRLREALERAGAGRDAALFVALEPGEVPEYLSAADAGVSFVKPSYSKKASSPTKIAEYLGTGLPVAINAGVGDADWFRRVPGAAVVVDSFDAEELDRAAARLVELVESRPSAEAHRVAAEWFDLDDVGRRRYADLYDLLLKNGRPVAARSANGR